MSFFTTIHFYRPGPALVISTAQLADFMERVAETGITTCEPSSLHLKYGKCIDKDMKPSYWWEPVNETGVISFGRSVRWNIDRYDLDFQSSLSILRNHDKSVYRALIDVGALADHIIAALSRDPGPENERGLYPDSLSIELGPTTISDPNEEPEYLVGWMSINLSGNGYLFPWTHRDLIIRLNACHEVQRLMSLCRETWPVEPLIPSPDVIALRKEMGELWGGDDYDAPADWRWGIQESW